MLKTFIDEEKITQLSLLLLQAHKVVIVAHVSPDGDAIGSSLGFAHFLRSIGKQATIIVPNPFPAFLKWMPGSKDIMIYERLKPYCDNYIRDAQLICCLDFNCLRRINDVAVPVAASKAHKVMIDHHPNPELFCELTLSYPEASSTSELVVQTIYAMHSFGRVSYEAAQCLYSGMMTDTGGFTYNSNRPEIYTAISMLLSKGIDKDDIYNKVFHTYSESRLRLMGYVLEHMKVYPDCHTALITLSREEQSHYEYAKGDSEGFVNLPLQIKGIILSCFLREDTEQGLVKVSLRSVGNFSCTTIAEQYFNGGGHLNASGGELKGTMEEAITRWEEVLDIIRPSLKAGDNTENNENNNHKNKEQ